MHGEEARVSALIGDRQADKNCKAATT